MDDGAADDDRPMVSLSLAALAIHEFSSPPLVLFAISAMHRMQSVVCLSLLSFATLLSSPSATAADDEAATFLLSFVYSLNFNLLLESAIGQWSSISSSCVVIAFRWYHCVI